MDLEIIKQEILDLYDICIEKTEPFHIKIDICIVPNYLSDLVFEKTGIDISNHLITIDNYGITHAILKHGNIKTELNRGQIDLEKEDFILFFDRIITSDNISFIGKTKKTSLTLLQFEKLLDSKIIIILEVRTIQSKKKNKANRLVFHTMYKKIKSNKN